MGTFHRKDLPWPAIFTVQPGPSMFPGGKGEKKGGGRREGGERENEGESVPISLSVLSLYSIDFPMFSIHTGLLNAIGSY